MQTFAMEVKISAKKKSQNDIACFNERKRKRNILDHTLLQRKRKDTQGIN